MDLNFSWCWQSFYMLSLFNATLFAIMYNMIQHFLVEYCADILVIFITNTHRIFILFLLAFIHAVLSILSIVQCSCNGPTSTAAAAATTKKRTFQWMKWIRRRRNIDSDWQQHKCIIFLWKWQKIANESNRIGCPIHGKYNSCWILVDF